MFQELAKQAYAEELAETEQAQQETKRRDIQARIKETIEMLEKMKVKHDAAQFNETTGVVTLDDVRFLGRRMYGKCPKCGEDTLSTKLWSLEYIGQMLTTFEPDNDHTFYQCSKRHDDGMEAQPVENESASTGKVLADALMSFLRDHGYDTSF